MHSGITLYTAPFTGNEKNTLYPRKAEIANLDDFRRAVAFDHVCAEYKNFHRSNDDFINADCLMLDCDNTHSDNPSDWLTPGDVHAEFPGVEFYICYSRNHNISKNGESPRLKFHVYFSIDTMTNAEEYAAMKNTVINRFPKLHFDTGAKDAARFFFGVKNPQVEEYEGDSHEAE